MTPDFDKLARAEPLHKSVQDAIRQYILDHKLEPGDALATEVELAQRLGVSRNSVREAVKSLQSVGLLESRHGSGLFVKAFSWDPLLDNLAYDLMKDLRSLAELLEVRQVLELGLLPQAVQRLTPEQNEEIDALLVRMKARATLGQGFPEEDRQFHRVLFRELQNGTVLKLLDVFWLAYRRAAESEADLVDVDPVGTYEAHRRIAEAVHAGDEAGAYRALEEHYRAIRDRLKAELTTEGVKEVPAGKGRSPDAPPVSKTDAPPNPETKE